ncbi:MAG: TonB-dependent receptor plug domain-containing protein [Flammeovirgaceae bacterium]
MNRLVLCLCCAWIIHWSQLAHAQYDSSFYQLAIDDLTQITVASNVITQKERQPVSITTITSEQLRLSGARMLSQAIMFYVPGFFLVEDQDDLIAGFRGLAADNNSKVLLLINGQNINTEFFWGPADAILHSTNYEYIDRVEVIRGPGSVTLGQGALLGVINIITKRGEKEKGSNMVTKMGLAAGFGGDGYLHGSVHASSASNKLKSYFYLSTNRYDGQAMRNEGWIAEKANEGFQGGTVADMGHRLHRTDNITMTGNISYKNFEVSAVYSDQVRDLYNFYRDREVFQQILTSINGSYNLKFTPNIRLKSSISYAQDHFNLSSLTGTTMGGTREDRYGFKSILNIDNLLPNNKLALGIEWRHFRMGKSNLYNNNFIANVINTFDPTTANQELSMGFENNINVMSIFLEDYFTINNRLDLFFAIRNDNHPFWGNSFTPRLGAIFALQKDLRFRFTYQSGFRGAVGLHYTGGYRRDGFLRADNYGQVANADIPLFEVSHELDDGLGNTETVYKTVGTEANIPEVEPERMNSFEWAINYKVNKFAIDATVFYNLVNNVIDVGVIFRDRHVIIDNDPTNDVLTDTSHLTYNIPSIGSDIAGDWNGYWYFKNTPGNFAQLGTEIALSYTADRLQATLSHAFVGVSTATAEQEAIASAGNSMYLAEDNGTLHFKAYPEHVTRLHVLAKPSQKAQLSLTSIYYSNWFSPSGNMATGGFIVNLGGMYKLTKNIGISLIAKNILNEQSLYPMTSNAGGPDESPGTPAWESTTYWGTIRFDF